MKRRLVKFVVLPRAARGGASGLVSNYLGTTRSLCEGLRLNPPC